ncbi:MAG TPA: hypothetical protein VMU80_26955 [Bryobacteraceae bacterium]|nr:hypothetical protein [Bryobacteraceae bacterium]
MLKRSVLTLIVGYLAIGQVVQAHDPHDPFVTVAVSPNYTQDQTVIAATDYLSIKQGVYALLKSTDGGVNWSFVPNLPNMSRIAGIAFSPDYSQDQTIFAGGGGGLARSQDQGATWSLLSQLSVVSVAVSPNYANDNTVFLITGQNTVLMSANSGQDLTQIPAPAGLTAGLSVIAVSPDYAVDHMIMVGSVADGIFRSTNTGAAWTLVTSGLQLPSVTAITYSPSFSKDATVFAGTSGSGFLVSTNGGNSFALSNAGLTDLDVTSIAVAPTYPSNPDIWLTSAVNGVSLSTNRGASWAPQPAVSRELSDLTTVHYTGLALAPNGPLFLAMYEGLWSSSSTKVSWQYIDTVPTRLIRTINLSPNFANDQTVFANTYGGGNLWSTSGGHAWTFQNTGMTYFYTSASAISPNYPVDGNALSSTGKGLERTTNGGATWQRMTMLGAPTNARALTYSPNFANDSTVLIGVNNTPGKSFPPYVIYKGKQYPNQGVFLSADGGNNWVPTTLSGPPISEIAISPAFAADRTAFAAVLQSGLYKSTDGGNTWLTVATPFASSSQVTLVAVSPGFATDRTVFAIASPGGMVKSTDGGNTWSLIGQTSYLNIMDIQLSPNYLADQTLYLGTVQEGIIRSTNGGSTLVQVGSFPDGFVTSIGISPNYANDHTLFAASYHGVFKSTNAGNSWYYTAEPARIEESRSPSGATGQPPPTITYQGAWTLTTPSTVASSNAYMITSAPQTQTTLNFTGTGVRWVSWTGPAQGSASVELDGAPQGTVSLFGSLNAYQQIVWQQTGLPCQPHTLVITPTSSSGLTVSVDAFDVWITSCPFTSVQMH